MAGGGVFSAVSRAAFLLSLWGVKLDGEREKKAKAGGVPRRRPLLLAVLLLLCVPVAYYGSYLVYGRWLPYPGDVPMGPGPHWGNKVGDFLYPLWDPLRPGDFRRQLRRMAGAFSGTWETADGRRLTLELVDWGGRREGYSVGEGRVSSDDLPWLNYSGYFYVVMWGPDSWSAIFEETGRYERGGFVELYHRKGVSTIVVDPGRKDGEFVIPGFTRPGKAALMFEKVKKEEGENGR